MKKVILMALMIVVTVTLLVEAGEIDSIHNIRKSGKGDQTIPGLLTIMTYDIGAAYGQNTVEDSLKSKFSKEDLSRIAEAIKAVDPDVIGLQGVKGSEEAEFLAKALNMNYTYGHHGAPKTCASRWGMALLSKYKISGSRTQIIYPGGLKCSTTRSVLECSVATPVKEIIFINSHFNHEGSVEEQAAKTIEIMPEPLKEPVFLLGDLGVLPGSKDLRPIEAKLTDTCDGVHNENSSFVKKTGTGHGRVDYVFFDSRSFLVKDVGLIPKEFWHASDHIGYFARVAFK